LLKKYFKVLPEGVRDDLHLHVIIALKPQVQIGQKNYKRNITKTKGTSTSGYYYNQYNS